MSTKVSVSPWRRGIGNDSDRIFDANGSTVADRAGAWDGHLIAAAPDLFAALKLVVDQIEDYERINNLAPNPGRQYCWDSVAGAKLAMAKAEGRVILPPIPRSER